MSVAIARNGAPDSRRLTVGDDSGTIKVTGRPSLAGRSLNVMQPRMIGRIDLQAPILMIERMASGGRNDIHPPKLG